jgi:acetolactate synthase I/II/III large subunit
MEAITGGELLVRCLASEGVRLLFGLPCPEAEPVLAALEGHGLRFVPVRHEAAAVHMAEGVYKTTGQVAAVIGNPGPGSANLLPGVITARHEGVPVFAITTQHRLGIVYPSPPSTFQGQDQLDVFRPAVKWGAPVLLWERIPEIMRMAAREMWAGRPGPVHLEIPAPVLAERGDPARAPLWAAGQGRGALPQPSRAQIDQAAELLAAAERPLVVAGAGVDRAGANQALLAVVECLGAPVIATMAGRAAVPQDHAHCVYGFGAGGDQARREADVVLVVGSRLGNLDLPFDKYWGDPARQQIVQIDVDPRDLGVTRPLALGINADAKAALEVLSEALAARVRVPRPGDYLARCREADQSWREQQLAPVRDFGGAGLHPAHVVEAVGRAFGRDAVYVTDGGMTSLWVHWFAPPTRPRSYHSILELGMLGTGIPSAIGAKLAAPDRDVVCMTGDGAAGFNFLEMQSAAREGLDLTTVVFAEGAWTMEEPSQLLQYGRTFGTEMGEVRWDKVAEGLGCQGLHVEKAADLDAALAEAKRHPGPSVVCVRTDRDANRNVPMDGMMRFVEVYQGPLG